MSGAARWIRVVIAIVVVCVSIPLGAAAQASTGRPGPVYVSTVPALSGVQLDIAGVGVVTGADGTASVTLASTNGVSHEVQLAGSAVGGGATVAISKVVRLPGAAQGVRLQIGLDVTSEVRLGIDPGTTGFATSSLRLVRLHSVAGQKLDIDPRKTRTIQLLARRTRLVGGTLTPQHVTWSVDLISAGPGLAMTTDMPRFDPYGHATWPLRLATVHGTVLIATVPSTPGVLFLIEGATVTTDRNGTAVAPVADLNGVRDRLRLASPDAGALQVSNLRVSKLPPKVKHQRRLVAALDVRRAVPLKFVDLRGKAVPTARVNRVRMSVGSATVVMTGRESDTPALLLVRVAAKVGSGWEARPVKYVLRSVLIDRSEAVFDGRQHFDPSTPGEWTVHLSVFSLRVSVHDAIFGSQVRSHAVITRPSGAQYSLRLGGLHPAVVPTLVRGVYGLRIDSALVGGATTLLISRDDTVDLRVVTLFDAVLIAAVALLLLVSVLAGGRMMARRRAPWSGVRR